MSHYPFKALAAGKPPLIPIIHVENADHAEPVLEALVAAGIGLVEVTLRTEAAIEVIRRMVKVGSPAIIGAGTITKPEQFAAAVDAGARFGVGPAFSPALFEAARKTGLPFVPGIGTASEALWAREAGFYELKLFPAEFAGGIGWLKHIEPIYTDLVFCPTAGINVGNARDFLACPNVFAVGGGYMAPRDRIEAEDWTMIENLSRQALAALRV